jgi:hypothetical protein
MKLLSQRAAIHFERPGRYGSFEIIACLAGANSARAALSRLQALDQVAADAIRCVLVLLITALSLVEARLPYDAPVTQTRGVRHASKRESTCPAKRLPSCTRAFEGE